MSASFQYWPFWAGSVALAAVAMLYYAITKRPIGISKSYDRVLRSRRPDCDSLRMEDDRSVREAALLLATQADFGWQFPSGQTPDKEVCIALPKLAKRPHLRWSHHAMLLTGLLLGGMLSAALGGRLSADVLPAKEHVHHFGNGALSWLVLFTGGLLSGFGARLAKGSESGPALVSAHRVCRPSVMASAVLFAAGIITAHLCFGRT